MTAVRTSNPVNEPVIRVSHGSRCSDAKDALYARTAESAVQWVAFLHIWEVPHSNLGRESGYPDRVFEVFVSPSRQISEQNLKLAHGHSLPGPPQLSIH
jgi:hypothetical protein